MKLSHFNFDLPPELIAQHPRLNRSESRLMTLSLNGEIQHHLFKHLPNLLQPGDLLVLNESKVIPARFFGRKISGGRVEFLIERILDSKTAITHIKSNRPLPLGINLILNNEQTVSVIDKKDGLFKIQLHQGQWQQTLADIGQMPLPPYITRATSEIDHARYQTIYAKHEGSVAAPTAGLHFDEPLLTQLAQKNIETAFVTLHVGAGTFQPVRTELIQDHKMHQEWMSIDEQVCQKIQTTRQQGGRIIAVGTTSVRVLETAAKSGILLPYSGPTDLFIYPGYVFHCVDAMITNFHLPKSSLLMLVSAFAGYENTLNAYQIAIQKKYQFFSYGDALLVVE